ncbi:MAG: hypothetical protein HGB36_07430 [Chlorobiaceae bacterium]|nr:hypothetical protein [Chlorobiaceae bacterium]
MKQEMKKVKAVIIEQLARQEIKEGPEGTLYILRYLDESGDISEAPEWIELEGWEPTSVEWPAPPKQNGLSMAWTELVNELSRQATLHGIDSLMKAVQIECTHP